MIRIRDIAIHTCNTCQLACDWCYAADAPRKSGFNEYTDAVIDFMAQCSYCHGISDANSVVNVCFMGGEPLCHKDKIVGCVERAKKLYPGIPMYFGCRTNMVDADRDFLRWAIDIGFNVGVSFDGCRKAHDAHRVYKNGSGSFDMVEKNILAFLEMSNGKVSHVRATAAPSTVRYMVDSYRYFKSIGIRDIVYGFTMNKPWNQSDVEAFQSSIQEIAEEIVKDYLGGHRFHFHNLSHPMRDAGMQGLPCGAAASSYAVTMNGEIVPCSHFAACSKNPFVFGHIGNRTIDMNAIFAYHRAVHRVIGKLGCKSCRFASLGCHMTCMGCHAAYENENTVDNLTCAMSKIQIQTSQWLYRKLFNNAMFIEDYRPNMQAMMEFSRF